ncbi:MAG: archease [Myxococcales bacterium]|nr:archease [Myxococcales bacterium]
MRGHRFFDHTGDFGADLEADSEAGLYEASVDALVGLLVDDVAAIREAESRALEVRGVDPEDQLVALGNEVLFLFETGWLARRVEVEELDEDALRLVAHGEPFEADRHVIARPIKAVTHHGARVEERADGTWVGRLIFDL